MICPSCNSTLAEKKTQDSIYFECLKCKGIFSRGEVISSLLQNLIIKHKADISGLMSPRKVENVYTLREKTINCPSCGQKMSKFNYATDSNIFADRCPNCQYIWLENGELEKIAKHLAPHPTQNKVGEILFNMVHDGDSNEQEQIAATDFTLALGPIPVEDFIGRYKIPLVNLVLILTNFLIALPAIIYWITQKDYGYGDLMSGFLPPVILLSSLFIHSGLVHLVGNLIFLWIFGDNVEDSLGHFKYILFYLTAGAVTGIIFTLLTKEVPVAGANGAVSAVMGSYLVLYPNTKLRIFFINSVLEAPSYVYFIFFITYQLLYFVSYGTESKFSYTGHIIGFLVGVAITVIMKKARITKEIVHLSEHV